MDVELDAACLDEFLHGLALGGLVDMRTQQGGVATAPVSATQGAIVAGGAPAQLPLPVITILLFLCIIFVKIMISEARAQMLARWF
jgi:hypothetical protein